MITRDDIMAALWFVVILADGVTGGPAGRLNVPTPLRSARQA
jgi:hypothetical protein